MGTDLKNFPRSQDGAHGEKPLQLDLQALPKPFPARLRQEDNRPHPGRPPETHLPPNSPPRLTVGRTHLHSKDVGGEREPVAAGILSQPSSEIKRIIIADHRRREHSGPAQDDVQREGG